jgi:Fibronectin type III domain
VAEDVSMRAATSITITWGPGPTNGGAPVIDYDIIYYTTADDIIVFRNQTSVKYTATGLTAGKTYTFKVEARNRYGNSASSTPV